MVRRLVGERLIAEAEGREEEFIQERMALHRTDGFSLERKMRDGRWRKSSERRLEDGATVLLISDITEQKQREEELKNQRDQLAEMQKQLTLEQQRFQAFAEASADWFWITNAHHRYVWISEAVEKFTHGKREDLIGSLRTEAGANKRTDPEWQAHLQQLAAREPFRDVPFRWNSPMGELLISSSGVPQFDEDGNFTGYFGTGRDLTELRRAEEAYETARDQLSMAIASISEGLMIFDPEDRLVLCNDNFKAHNPDIVPELQPGEDYRTIIEKASRIVLPEDWNDRQRQAWLDRRLDLRDSENPVMEFPTRLGEWCRITEHRTANGGTVMVRTDITDLKQRQSDLEVERNNAQAANRAKTEFRTNISHELRTPLNAIIGFSDVMARGLFGPLEDRYAAYANDIGVSGRHLLSLINDLLDSARIESGKYELGREIVGLGNVLRQTELLIQPILDGRNLQLDILPDQIRDGDALDLNADPCALRQILLNLLSNAAKFSDEGGRVTLSAVATGGDLEIQVRDHGLGMGKDDLERVFERFEQLQDPMRRSHEGSGIGLPLSRSLAELHGGTLHLELPETGRGVIAVLRLPGCVNVANVVAEPKRSTA